MNKNFRLFYLLIFTSCVASNISAMQGMRSACAAVGNSIGNAVKTVCSTTRRSLSYVSSKMPSLPGYFTSERTYVPAPQFPPFPSLDAQRCGSAAGQVIIDHPTVFGRMKAALLSARNAVSEKCSSAVETVKDSVQKNKQSIIRSVAAVSGLVGVLLSYKYWKSKMSGVPASSPAVSSGNEPSVPETPVQEQPVVNSTPVQQAQPANGSNTEKQPEAQSSTNGHIVRAAAAAITFVILGKTFGYDMNKWGSKDSSK